MRKLVLGKEVNVARIDIMQQVIVETGALYMAAAIIIKS